MSNTSLIIKVLEEAVRSRISPSIKHLILHVTRKCNIRCKHCFVDFNISGQELTFGEIKTISEEIRDPIWLDIGGGEPLLRDDLEEIVSLFNFRELSIPTNGWETEEIVDKLRRINLKTSGKLVVSISLDGMEKTHDEMRCPGSFKRAVQTFETLKGIKGMRVKFNTVLCEKNCDEITDLMRFAKTLGPDFHSILMLRGKTLDPTMRLPSAERIKAFEGDVSRIQETYNYGRGGILSRVQKNYQAYKGDLVLRTLKEKKQIVSCLAGSSHLVIWPDGGVSACELLPPIGNIREKSLKELLVGKEMKDQITSIRKGECFCTHDCNMIENILFNPKSYLRLLR